MMLKEVNLDSTVYEMIINHALSNEKEEIMGLLIGNIVQDENFEKEVCKIYISLVFERLDKRADRVEISPEQLSLATEFAEKLSIDLNERVYIIGWYHSHPRITVFPSHVDIRTQNMYQIMDSNFIGIIVSVFNETKTTFTNNVEMICFKADQDSSNYNGYSQIPIKVTVNENDTIILNNLQNLFKIPKVLMQEENSSFQLSASNKNFLCAMSNIGIYMHSMSQIIDIAYLGILNSLKCQTAINSVLIADNEKTFLNKEPNDS